MGVRATRARSHRIHPNRDASLRPPQELIDLIEVVYRGGKKGRGLVVAPKDHSTQYKY